MERSTVHTLLDELAESPAPPSTVDIGRAAAAGRRTVRLHRVLAGGSAALAVAAIVGILSFVISSGAGVAPRPAPVGSGSATNSTSPDRPMPEQAPATFDPTVRYAEFGWIPDGAPDIGFTATSEWLSLEAVYSRNGEDPGYVSVVIVTAGHGVDPAKPDNYAVPADSMPEGLELVPVNGRPAQFSDALGEAYVLRWEYAPGAWAAVVVRNMDDMKDVARQVASDVRFAANTQVRLPYRTTALPAGLPVRVVQVHQSTDAAHWSATVQYGQERTTYGDWPLNITAIKSDAESGDGAVIGDPNTTVDGHPARTSTGLDGGSGLQLFNVNGVYLEMMTHSPQTTAQLQGGLVGLFRGMEIYADPASWR
jgi:hypothetical protein